MNVAIVVEHINKYSTSVRVTQGLWELFPHADIYTMSYDKRKIEGTLWKEQQGRIHVLSGKMRAAFERVDLSSYDCVFSIGTQWAKAVIVSPHAMHIHYCVNTNPMLWEYEQRKPASVSWREKRVLPLVYSYLRLLDRIASDRPDFYIAPSKEMKQRIQKYYRRPSTIIFPPIDVMDVKIGTAEPKMENYYLYVGALESYKKVEEVIHAFNLLGYKLIIVGSGNEGYVGQLKSLAKINISFVQSVSNEQLRRYYLHAKGLIYTMDENFATTVIEQQAYGRGIIGYRHSSASDLVIENMTGVLFDSLDRKSIKKAVKEYTMLQITRQACIENAYKYTKRWFHKFLKEYLVSIKIYAK